VCYYSNLLISGNLFSISQPKDQVLRLYLLFSITVDRLVAQIKEANIGGLSENAAKGNVWTRDRGRSGRTSNVT
jgi:hypothetical protein